MSECKRKLVSSVNRLDKILDVYDSTPLEKCLYDTCKAEGVLKESKDVLGRHRSEYQRSATKLREINEKLSAAITG